MTKPMMTVLSLTTLIGASLGCASTPPQSVITGTAMYRERMALPPGAILEVTLEDVSRMDSKAEVLGQVTIEDPGNPPFSFEITFDAATIDDRHTYSVRAKITVQGSLMFTTDQSYPVLTRGAGTEIDLMLRRVQPQQEPKANSALRNTYWKVLELQGRAVPVQPNQREAHLLLRLDGRVTGFSGCNQLMGPYEAGVSSIDIGPLAMTKRACLHGMEHEQAMTTALEVAATWRIIGEHLELFDGEGQVLARFQAIYLK